MREYIKKKKNYYINDYFIHFINFCDWIKYNFYI